MMGKFISHEKAFRPGTVGEGRLLYVTHGQTYVFAPWSGL